MRILFGSEHDHRHIDPSTPGGYEWWYFDAISDDDQYILVAIFFLGTPMSPYYKAVVDARNVDTTPPLPKDWCAVSFTLHKRTFQGRFREIAYAYNLYRTADLDEANAIRIGPSTLVISNSWKFNIDEPGLWGGRTKAELEFKPAISNLTLEPLGEDDGHTWICSAPVCRVEGTLALPAGKTLSFTGRGYHDHNFGELPWDDIDFWIWGRFEQRNEQQTTSFGIYYQTVSVNKRQQEFHMLLDETGNPIVVENRWGTLSPLPKGRTSHLRIRRNSFGLEYRNRAGFRANPDSPTVIQYGAPYIEGPFYRRSEIVTEMAATIPEIRGWNQGTGLGEVFRPVRLCHPLWSRLMWTRIRRRS